MKSKLLLFLLSLQTLALSSCEVVGRIFKAGMVWGIFLVILIVGGIIYLITRMKK